MVNVPKCSPMSQVRGGKRIPLKATVDRAVKECKDVTRVLVMRRTGAEVKRAHEMQN